MSSTKKGPSPQAIRKASSPEARAKAVATMKARRAAKETQQELTLDAIPDRVPKKKYTKKQNPNLATIRVLLTTALALIDQL